MAAAKSSSRKASKATKTSKASKTTPHTAARVPARVTKPHRVRKPSAKARQSQQDRPHSVTLFLGIISPDEIPETDLEHPYNVHPRLADLERRLAEWEGGKNAHLKGHRVIDHRR